MFKRTLLGVCGWMLVQGLFGFLAAETKGTRHIELRSLFQKAKSPTISDLLIEEKWTCSVDDIQFVFSQDSKGRLSNRLQTKPTTYLLDSQALKIFEPLKREEGVKDYLRVSPEKGDLIVEQTILMGYSKEEDWYQKLLPSLIDPASRVTQYYICPRSQVSPLYVNAQRIVHHDFSLPKMMVNISEAEVSEQEVAYPSPVSFEGAIYEAIQNLYQNKEEEETVLAQLNPSQEGSSAADLLGVDVMVPLEERLRGHLDRNTTILELLTPSQKENSPFGVEILKSHWVFQLTLPSLNTDEVFWVFVDRQGRKETYQRVSN